MIIAMPGQRDMGQKTKAMVEFVDLFPTLAAAAGIPAPEDVQGTSRLALLHNASGSGAERVFSQWPSLHRPNGWNDTSVFGLSMRKGDFRIVAWCHYDFLTFAPDFEKCVAFELYSYEGIAADDESRFDLVDLASDPRHAGDLRDLREDLRLHWPS